MNDIILQIVLLMMVIMAILTVVSSRLFIAIIFSGILSLFCAFLYVLLGAPDVALAEAVIGSTIVTVIFLVTLKKYRIFNIYITGNHQDTVFAGMIKKVSKILQKSNMEVHILYSNQTAEELVSHHNCDLVVEGLEEGMILHGEKGNQYMINISKCLQNEIKEGIVTIKEE
ncbi:MAG: DUF4040 domain-containing protein [Eubacteriales bacterium]